MKPDETFQDDAKYILQWLYLGSLPDSLRKLLSQADEARQAGDYDTARWRCREVIDQVSAPNPLNSLNDSWEGLARMYLGMAYYAEGNLGEAVEKFKQACAAFTLHSRNQAVAEFALGATYARLGERTKVNEHITQDVLNALRYAGEAKGVDLKWQQISDLLAQTHSQSRPSSAVAPSPTLQAGPMPVLPRTPLDVPAAEGPGPGERLVGILAPIAVVVAGAVAAWELSQRIAGVIAYLLVVPTITFLITKGLKHDIPVDHALVIETSGGPPKVRWGPDAYYRWPVLERIHATVPLYPLQYSSPSKNIQLGPGETVDIRLTIYYGVDSRDKNRDSVLNSLYRLQPEQSKSSIGQREARKQTKPYTSEDVRRFWEKRLLTDIVASLNEVLPGRKYDHLAGGLVDDRVRILHQLRQRLAERVHEWGMAIEEVGIAEIAKGKA